jgi:hypothetical protein
MGSGSASGDGTADAGSVDAAGPTSDWSACGDGIVVPGVQCWIEVPLTWPEGLTPNTVRAFGDGRVLFVDQDRAKVAVLDYAARGPALGPVVSSNSAEFHHTMPWALSLQLDTDPSVEIITSGYSAFALYEARGDVVELGATGSAFPNGPGEGFMLVAIDVDGDGIDELVRARRGWLAVWRLDTVGNWTMLSDPLPQPPCHALNLAVADFDGDGRDDLVVLGNHGYGTHPSNGEEFCPNYDEGFDDMYILLNRYPEQRMEAPFELVVGPEVPFRTVAQLPTAPTMVPGDYDGDGHMDLFLVRGGDLRGERPWFMRGQGNGWLSQPMELDLPVNRAVVGDFDGDGSVDVIADAFRANGPDGLWIWWGSGVEWHAVDVESVAPEVLGPIVATDMNGDGVDDLMITGGYLLISNP